MKIKFKLIFLIALLSIIQLQQSQWNLTSVFDFLRGEMIVGENPTDKPKVIDLSNVVKVFGIDEIPSIKVYKPVTMKAVGDIMLSREVGRKIVKAGDWKHSFLNVGEFLADSDITLANLETTVFKGRKIGAYEMSFRSEPEVLEGVKYAGIDIVSLANNHTYNFGEQGIIKTMQHLNAENIQYCGAGVNETEARQPAIIEKNGVTFAFLCYNDTDVVPDYTFASETKAGTAELVKEDMITDVKKLVDGVDFIIVSMHSGHEYHKLPNKKQKEFAKAAIDSGAKVVIGHHPHVLQPVEYYNDGIIMYSLGNFIFDQVGVWQNRGVIANLTFDKNEYSVKAEFTPTKITDYSKVHIETDEIAKKATLDRLVMPK
ncbi:CapA family protein [Patescibacteria group bacterium]|nr:CapA family protein [Patescibacteria group bacterium]